jgi:hypothetical protein
VQDFFWCTLFFFFGWRLGSLEVITHQSAKEFKEMLKQQN